VIGLRTIWFLSPCFHVLPNTISSSDSRLLHWKGSIQYRIECVSICNSLLYVFQPCLVLLLCSGMGTRKRKKSWFAGAGVSKPVVCQNQWYVFCMSLCLWGAKKPRSQCCRIPLPSLYQPVCLGGPCQLRMVLIEKKICKKVAFKIWQKRSYNWNQCTQSLHDLR